MFHPRGPGFWELVKQALSSTRQGYDLLAPKFEHTPYRTPDQIIQPVLELAEPYQSALDLCCGTGAATALLVKNARVTAVDFSRGMLDQAKRILNNPENVTFIQADALKLPIPDQTFDLAVSFGALGHILPKDQQRFAAEIYRVLKPNGAFLTVTSHPPAFWSKEHLFSRLFNAALHLRNTFWPKRFEMYYLKFMSPRIKQCFEKAGFQVAFPPTVFKGNLAPLIPVVAKKPPIPV